jgi:hypothetical protein
MAEERTHSRDREQRSSRAPVQNVDMDEDNKEEGWHLDAEEDEIEDAMNVEEIVKEWQMSIPFINRGMKHPCTQFTDKTPMPEQLDFNCCCNILICLTLF